MPPDAPLFEVEFYREPGGDKPVAVLLRDLNVRNRALAVRIQAVLQRLKDPRWHRAPYTKDIGDDVLEARVHDGDDARILFFHAGQRRLIIVHAFVKKTTKTPSRDKELAVARMQRWRAQQRGREVVGDDV